MQGYTNMTWTLTGKVKSVFYTIDGSPTGTLDGTDRSEIEFAYDAGDYRLSKEVTDGTNTTKYFYMRDGSGNPMAVYKQIEETVNGALYQNTYLLENTLYGSKRLGTADYGTSRLISSKIIQGSNNLDIHPTDEYNSERGYKRYELSNHLGNVLAVVSDMVNGQDGPTPNGRADYYAANVISASDYYPYGWVISDRKANPTDYRYGFNGQEQDAEWRGGQAVSFRFRIHDPRLGKFLSVDPLAPEYPWNSSYAFAENDVIRSKDLEGMEKKIANGIWDMGYGRSGYKTFAIWDARMKRYYFQEIPVINVVATSLVSKKKELKNRHLQKLAKEGALIAAGFTPAGVAIDVYDLTTAMAEGDTWGIVFGVVGFIPFGDLIKNGYKIFIKQVMI